MNGMVCVIALAILALFSHGYSQQRVQALRRVGSDIRVMQSPSMAFEEISAGSSKSVFLAAGLSVILPGAGELYACNFESGKYSLIAEAAVWITYAGFYSHASWVRQDARLFATQRSGARFDSKDDKFAVDIGNFNSTSDYNQAKLRNREYDLLYMDPVFNWQWDTDQSRVAFKNERIRSDEIFQNAKFVIIAAVVNRVFSAFSAGRAASAHNRRVLIEGAWKIKADPRDVAGNRDGISITMVMEF